MARQRNGYYETIEYIGPRPQKKKRRHFFGGWVILVIAVGIGTWFGRPLVPMLKANQQEVSIEQAELLISHLRDTGGQGAALAAHALAHSGEDISYDAAYYKIEYPNGDIAAAKGNAADVVIRCFRGLGIDLQRELHEDMTGNFRLYQQLWGAIAPDPNIDHRRIPNLERFFERHGQSLTPTRNPADYRPGDIVVWSLANAEKHIGIVVPGPGKRASEPWVVHHKDTPIKWENTLFDYKIESHFRYPAPDDRVAEK
ncbi:MAG TPA: DUF1287 domain-containing protein [Luteolibacter sp.]|nr:DUF1287 domain-containing protein [Luteolibacter sp.]